MYDVSTAGDLYIYNSFESSLLNGINWVYSIIDYIPFYDFKVVYNKNATVGDNIFFENLGYETSLWDTNSNIFYWSILVDKNKYSLLNNYPYLNDWTRYNYSSSTLSFISYIHPELSIINDNIVTTLVNPYISSFAFIIASNLFVESFLSPISIVITTIILFFFLVLLISLYFSHYSSSVKEENTIDQDYLVAAMSIEAEEEIASIDDTSLVLVLLVYIFGWFFYVNGIYLLSNIPEISLIFYNLPFLYYMIVLMPLFLLYDYGIYFIAYLRGSSTVSSLLMEALYDYIALAAFYIRLLVQNVRLLLMTFTYFSLYECILTYVSFTSWFNVYETLWENNSYTYTNYSSYYFLLKLPTQLIYWLYELGHTFFVITAQFVAFFAMAFWLYLFLFTMFVAEQQEKYFFFKKIIRKSNLKKILDL